MAQHFFSNSKYVPGYGYPATSTAAGRVASIFYILFGIPIFLIILKVSDIREELENTVVLVSDALVELISVASQITREKGIAIN